MATSYHHIPSIVHGNSGIEFRGTYTKIYLDHLCVPCYCTWQVRVRDFSDWGSFSAAFLVSGVAKSRFRVTASFARRHPGSRRPSREPPRVKLFGINTYKSVPKRASNYL